MGRTTVGLVTALFILVSGAAGFAQRPATTFPVIVVFKADAALNQFRGSFRVDARSQANPAAWDYLDRDVVGATMALENRHRFQADHVYGAALRGFAARLTITQMFELENNPLVDYIEPDGEMRAPMGSASAFAQTVPWGISRVGADLSSTAAGDGSGTVTNVRIFIIDTGIDAGHTDLTVGGHVNFAGGPNTDCNGHGTHVSGTAAAEDNTSDVVGVAPGAVLYGVKVLGCGGSGSTSGVIKGVDYVKANAAGTPAVANMSLGGGASTALDNAVINAANAGVLFAVAAGNSGVDACTQSPARAGAGTNNGVITVAATDSNNNEPSWSNYGSCVDIWAPGVSILSTRKGGGTTTMSGTSMASPHVTGGAALYRSTHTGDPAAVESALKAAAATLTGNLSKSGSAIKLLKVNTF